MLIHRLDVAHREQRLRETFRYANAHSGKVPAQRFTKSKGAAKPEARLPPFRHGGAYSLAIEAAIACIDQNMQANMGSRRIRLQLAQSLLVDFGRAVEEINLRSEEHTSELQSLMRNSYAVFCL